MRNCVRFFVSAVFVVGALLTGTGPSAFAAVPQLINYQGVLTDSAGKPIRNDSASVRFRIYDVATGGTELWEETQDIATDKSGAFGVLLGSTVSIPYGVFSDSARWLGIRVESDPEMSPRLRLVAVGYAFEANNAELVDGYEGVELEESAEIDADIDTHSVFQDAHREHASLEESAEIDADIDTHSVFQDAHREHASLEESAEIDADIDTHSVIQDAHREHSSLEESAEIDADIDTHNADASAHPFLDPPVSSVDQTALKTATGEVSVTNQNLINVTLPGGEYGFYPRLKCSSGCSGGTAKMSHDIKVTSFITNINLSCGSGTVTAIQRYVTASGQDHWVFLLVDKTSGATSAAFQAPDHPCYGNGGNPDEVPHPFLNYDSANYEIVLIDHKTTKRLKAKAAGGGSILDIINAGYRVDMRSQSAYVPLHTGRFLGESPVLLESIPDYIKVRQTDREIDGTGMKR